MLALQQTALMFATARGSAGIVAPERMVVVPGAHLLIISFLLPRNNLAPAAFLCLKGSMSTRRDRMETLLKQELEPTRLEIDNFSASHAGHAGAGADGESHFSITLETPLFAGLSRAEQHRWIYRILAHELQSGLHALVLRTGSPANQGGSG